MSKNTIKIGAIAALLAGAAWMASAQTETATETEAASEAPVIATEDDLAMIVGSVNGEEVSLGDLLVVKSQLPDGFLQGSDQENFETLLQQFGVQVILAENAPEKPVLQLQAESATRQVYANANLRAYVEENLTDEYLQKTYDEVIGSQPDAEEFNASHILVDSDEKALEVKKRVDDGEDFAEVAKEASTGPSAPNGGELGWFGPGQMVPEFEQAVQALEPGQVSDPVQTQFGFHIIKLNEKRAAAKPTMEEVDSQLREYASNQLIDEYVTEIREGAEIEQEEGVDPKVINEILPQ